MSNGDVCIKKKKADLEFRMKYLVTGANGYIGQGVVKTMLDWEQKLLRQIFILMM